MATQIEIQSKIKTIYIELPEYQFQHGVTSDYSYFIGREKVSERLRNILLNAKDGSGGVYLVAGYRGMGKTSLVNKVIEDVKKEGRTYHPILISLSQDDIREFDVLKFFATQFYLVWSQINFNKTIEQCKKEISYISLRLGWLFDHLNAIVKTHTHTKSKYGFEQEHKGKEVIRKESVPKEIEKELIYLLQLYEDIREKSGFPRLIFIIDELDKIEPSYLYNIDYNHNDLPSQSELDNIFGINKVRRRQEVITRILANLKSFLNTAKAKFVFIGGREMYDAALADIADRDSFYSSIFHDVMYVNSFLKDQLTETRSGITRLTEAFLCKLLLPVNYVEAYQKESTSPNELRESKKGQIYNLTTYYHYLIDIFRCKGDRFNPHYSKARIQNINDSNDKNAIYKLVFFLQNTIFFLTCRSNGTPKKLVALVESYMVSLNTDKISKILSNNNNIVVSCPDSARKGEKQFMYFSFNHQYEIGLTANIYRPYVLIHSRYLKSLGDKLLYSTAYIMDYILKFHPHAFSWRHLELIPEIILVNRDPNFRYYLSDIMKFLSRMYIRETTNGMFMYKFYKKQSSEIQLLTKVSEGSSAAFNFTLDESLHIIRYYRRKLEQLQSTHTNFNNEYIHSIGFIQGILGDLYYFEREYDEAIVYYTDSIQVLRRLAQQEPQKMTKHQVVLYVRHKLLLGLCLEKIKAFDSAYSIYRGIILNIPRLLEKVVDVDVPQVQMNASILSDDEWDKPIRRMQLFIKPHIALLDLIEKQRMDGITYANLSRNFTEVYEFLIDSGQNKRQEIAIGKGIIGKKKKMDSMRVSLLLSDYYANVGSLLFFKNRNFPELHELLNHHLLTNSKSSDFQIFIKQRKGKSDNKDFNPSLSSLTYYYLALHELIESYMPKLRSVGKAEGISIDELKDSDNAFIKTLHLLYPEYLGVVNTAILFIFGNLLSRLGDTLLASLSRSSLENYQLKSEVLSLFSEDDMNEILFGVRKTSMKEAKDGKRKDSPIIDSIRNLLKKEQNKSNDKNDLRCQLSTFCDINTVLVLYRLAGLFYMKSGRTYSYAFQYKKLLFVLKDYLLCSNQDSYLSKIADTKDPKETYKTISSACENIAERIFSTTTWVSDVANRPQILKYRDIFKYQKMDVSEQLEISKDETRQIYLSLSTSAEIREVISIIEEIKIKLIRILHIEDSFGPKIKSNITSYDLLTNRFSRVHELRYQSEFNYFRLQIKHMDTILKSPILSDINLLGPIRDLKILKDIGAAILKDGRKVSITSVCKNAGNLKLSANKIQNIDLFVKQRFEELIAFPNKKLSKKEVTKAFPEFFLNEHELKLKEILSDSKVPEMICDSIFALYEVIRTLNLFGISYMSNHSFLANIHFKLANWCQIAANYDILSEYESKNDSLGKRRSMQETLREILKEEDNYSLEPNYHNELAIQHYYSALESHSEGNAYKSINQSMSFLEDDFNDNLTHFSAASERFRINTGLVNQKIVDLKRKIRFSNLYTYQHYLAADDF